VESSNPKVVVRPSAFCTIALHAVQHKNEAVHGILLGSSEKKVITVQEAVAVCHGAPTMPLVETAVGLVQAKSDLKIVGWYTAPTLLVDTQPSPVGMRMAANFATESIESTLIMVNNANLAECLRGKGKNDGILIAHGKDFGQQYMEPLETIVEGVAGAVKAVQEAIKRVVTLNDLVDHLDQPASSSWYPNKDISTLVDKFC